MPPVVSVVTPFYNTAPYLRECIESVLAQSFGDFEYLLVNNCSTDGSDRIAQEYADRDPRIRLIHNAEFVGQVENYNGAVRQISPKSRYLKIVQADDWLFPQCLARMVALADAHPSVAIVGSAYLEGDEPRGYGVPPEVAVIGGRETCRGHLLGTIGIFGTPTTLMYRADLVGRRQPFYRVGRLHEDSELCFEVLRDGDFGYVHETLSFMRVGNPSILSGVSTYDWRALDAYITIRMFGREYLSEEEYRAEHDRRRRDYLARLGEAVLFRRERAYWDYHRRGLATIDETIDRAAIRPYLPRAVGRAVVRPDWAVRQLRVTLGARRA